MYATSYIFIVAYGISSKEEPGVEGDGEGLAAYQTVTASYGRKRMFTIRDHNVDSLSPKFPPPPFPMSVWSTGLLEDRHGCCVHYHCGRPWNYRRGAAFSSEKARDAWNRTRALLEPCN